MTYCNADGCTTKQREGMGEYASGCEHCHRHFWECHPKELVSFVARIGDYTKTIFADDSLFDANLDLCGENGFYLHIRSDDEKIRTRNICVVCKKCARKFFDDFKMFPEFTVLPKSSMTPFVSPKSFWNPLVLRKPKDRGEQKYDIKTGNYYIKYFPIEPFYDLKYCHNCFQDKERFECEKPGKPCCWPYNPIQGKNGDWKEWLNSNMKRYGDAVWMNNNMKHYDDVFWKEKNKVERDDEIGVWL